jgi:hypothetical protein
MTSLDELEQFVSDTGMVARWLDPKEHDHLKYRLEVQMLPDGTRFNVEGIDKEEMAEAALRGVRNFLAERLYKNKGSKAK